MKPVLKIVITICAMVFMACGEKEPIDQSTAGQSAIDSEKGSAKSAGDSVEAGNNTAIESDDTISGSGNATIGGASAGVSTGGSGSMMKGSETTTGGSGSTTTGGGTTTGGSGSTTTGGETTTGGSGSTTTGGGTTTGGSGSTTTGGETTTGGSGSTTTGGETTTGGSGSTTTGGGSTSGGSGSSGGDTTGGGDLPIKIETIESTVYVDREGNASAAFKVHNIDGVDCKHALRDKDNNLRDDIFNFRKLDDDGDPWIYEVRVQGVLPEHGSLIVELNCGRTWNQREIASITIQNNMKADGNTKECECRVEKESYLMSNGNFIYSCAVYFGDERLYKTIIGDGLDGYNNSHDGEGAADKCTSAVSTRPAYFCQQAIDHLNSDQIATCKLDKETNTLLKPDPDKVELDMEGNGTADFTATWPVVSCNPSLEGAQGSIGNYRIEKNEQDDHWTITVPIINANWDTNEGGYPLTIGCSGNNGVDRDDAVVPMFYPDFQLDKVDEGNKSPGFQSDFVAEYKAVGLKDPSNCECEVKGGPNPGSNDCRIEVPPSLSKTPAIFKPNRLVRIMNSGLNSGAYANSTVDLVLTCSNPSYRKTVEWTGIKFDPNPFYGSPSPSPSPY